MNALAKRIPNPIGGSADLNPSTGTAFKGLENFQAPEMASPSWRGGMKLAPRRAARLRMLNTRHSSACWICR